MFEKFCSTVVRVLIVAILVAAAVVLIAAPATLAILVSPWWLVLYVAEGVIIVLSAVHASTYRGDDCE